MELIMAIEFDKEIVKKKEEFNLAKLMGKYIYRVAIFFLKKAKQFCSKYTSENNNAA